MEEFQADIHNFLYYFFSIFYGKNGYKWSDMQNVIYSILQNSICPIVSLLQTKIFLYNVAL